MTDLINIEYKLKKRADVSLTVINSFGQPVAGLENRIKAPGEYKLKWDATDESGYPFPNGLYIIRLQVDGEVSYSKIVRTR